MPPERLDEPALVPELAVTDLARSLEFWVGLLGFRVLYQRADEGFASLQLGGARIMLDQVALGRTWATGELERPLGRGINLELEVPDLDAILHRLAAADWPLFLAPEERWYRAGEVELGVRQFLVQDPDGYLVRPQVGLGERPAG